MHRLRNALLRLPPLTRSDAQLSRITNLQESASAFFDDLLSVQRSTVSAVCRSAGDTV